MFIDAITENPKNLISTLDKSIEDHILKTWKKFLNNKKETLYSHIPPQWNEKAMMKPYIQKDKVQFIIAWWSKNEEPSEDIKGYVLGRFVEALMVHFKSHFKYLEIQK